MSLSKGPSVVEPVSAKEKKTPDEWEIKDAADTLTKAQEIKANKHLMPHVVKHLSKKKKHVISSLEELKAHAQERTKQLQGRPNLLDDGDGPDQETSKDKKKEGY